jgi:hypothetical protein
MKIQMDASDLREAVCGWLKARKVEAGNVDMNIHSVGGALVSVDVIVREEVEGGPKPRTRRIPIIGAP